MNRIEAREAREARASDEMSIFGAEGPLFIESRGTRGTWRARDFIRIPTVDELEGTYD